MSATLPIDPAMNLVGRVLNDRWQVTNLCSRDPKTATGACFSIPYECEEIATGKKAFLKLIHIIRTMQLYSAGRNHWETMKVVIDNHAFEVFLIDVCKKQKMSRVAHAVDHGNVTITADTWGDIDFPFIIFDRADGDMNSLLAVEEKVDELWKISTLHQVATAVKQLHKGNIAHQDIKRSNVIFFGDDNAKLTDLGRAVSQEVKSYNEGREIPCEPQNSPPELIYKHVSPDFGARHFATDLYMLGNLAYTLFFNITVTARLVEKLPPSLHPGRFAGDYRNEILPALHNALGSIVAEIGEEVPKEIRDDFKTVIGLLCNPDPLKRGHPRDHAMAHSSKYSAERFISAFDAIRRKTKTILSR